MLIEFRQLLFYTLSCSADRTVASSNGVNLNGESAQNLRFSGGGDQTLKANKVNIVTIIIHQDNW